MTNSAKKRPPAKETARELGSSEDANKIKPDQSPENKRHKEDFERLLDDAVLGVTKKQDRN